MTDRDDAVPTGPRPETGKADPSRNATTHGLTARRPLCEQEAERLRILIDAWAMSHRPETEAEQALVQTAAIEYVRYLRCVQADERQLGPNARDALADWQEKRRHAIRRKAQDLRDDPARVAAELHESAFGIDWLVRHWRTLLGYLESGRGWIAEDVTTALHLLGRPAQCPADSDIDARGVYLDAAAACPMAFDFRAARGIVDAEAAERLREFVADRIERLEALRPLVWEEMEGPQAEAVEASAMVDTSKEGQLRHRYRREALRDMHRGIGMLIRLKVERSKIDDRLARQDRMGAAPRPSPTADAPSPSPRPTEAPAPVPRNEPPDTAEPSANHRQNPNSDQEIRRDPALPSAAPDRRTATPPEAHRTRPDGPDPSPRPPGSPSTRPAGVDRRD